MLSAIKTLPLLLLLAALAPVHASQANRTWPAWRGDIAGSGVASADEFPLEWGKEKNVRGRVDLPKAGNSTPIIPPRVDLCDPACHASSSFTIRAP